MSKFEVGDRVRVRATYSAGWVDPLTKRGDQRIIDGATVTITKVENIGSGYYWAKHKGVETEWLQDKDLELVTKGEEMKPYQRKTYKLIKDTPTMLKGAILQEQCDDGTQPYVMLNQETHCKDPSYKISIAKRELVEDQPKWFVEVFKVTPEYMTREELDQWEAFKRSAKPKTLAVKRTEKAVPVIVSDAVSYQHGRLILSSHRTKQVVKIIKLCKKNDKAVARTLGVAESTAKQYRRLAEHNGLI